MSDSPTKSPCSNTCDPEGQPTTPINAQNLHKIHGNDLPNQIPVEIVSEEEMALLEAALSLAAAACPSSLSVSSSSRFSLLCSQLGRNSKRALSNLARPSSVGDVDDSGRLVLVSPKKKCKVPETFLSRFRRRKGLYVTDVTATVFTALWFLGFLVSWWFVFLYCSFFFLSFFEWWWLSIRKFPRSTTPKANSKSMDALYWIQSLII